MSTFGSVYCEVGLCAEEHAAVMVPKVLGHGESGREEWVVYDLRYMV